VYCPREELSLSHCAWVKRGLVESLISERLRVKNPRRWWDLRTGAALPRGSEADTTQRGRVRIRHPSGWTIECAVSDGVMVVGIDVGGCDAAPCGGVKVYLTGTVDMKGPATVGGAGARRDAAGSFRAGRRCMCSLDFVYDLAEDSGLDRNGFCVWWKKSRAMRVGGGDFAGRGG